ncbi:hypothetical protein Cni_G24507 [Canna indica]|uniref:Uncharacterized protein n=1 Tax=Canna indica TaxID=4628 RepID=A0AAQ3QK64_9LILI|nr:hypothetical protein Cni_G24507 [Canna indica]
MAKKKHSVAVAGAADPLPAEDHSPEQWENLKTLNQFLLKQTTELREQVNDLQSRVDRLSVDHSLSSDLEHSVIRLVVSARLAELAAELATAVAQARSADERLELVSREKGLVEKALDAVSLERDSAREDLNVMKRESEERVAALREEAEKQKSDLEQRKAYILSLEGDKAAMEGVIRSMEEALRSTTEQFLLIKGEKGEIEKDLQRTIFERDTCKRDLEALSMALQTAQEKMQSSQAANLALKDEIARMQLDFDEGRTNMVMEVDKLKEKVRSIESNKEVLEQQKVVLETKVASLQGRVSELHSVMQEKVALEEKLSLAEETVRISNENLEIITAEKDDIKMALDRAITEIDLNQLKLAEEEKSKAMVKKEIERLGLEVRSLEREKERLQLEIKGRKMDYMKEIVGLRDMVKKVEEEKDKINRLGINQEAEINKLNSEVAELLSTVSQLQDMCRISTENNVQLQADKESAISDLHLKKKEVDCLMLQVDELNKNKDNLHNELCQTKASLDSLIAENQNIKGDFGSLIKEKAALEEKLQNTLHVVKEFEEKCKTADENFRKVLSLLKGTSEIINGLEEGKQNDIPRQISREYEMHENIRNVEDELEAIRLAFKSRAAKSEDMNQELKVLRSAMAETKKRGGVFTWLYPAAATFFAVVSFAYAAKCR